MKKYGGILPHRPVSRQASEQTLATKESDRQMGVLYRPDIGERNESADFFEWFVQRLLH